MHNKLTRKDIEEMQKEIDYRKTVVRPQVLDEVKETRAHGDLSENFEYHEAKRVKNRNDSRIRFLERMIKTAEVIEDESAADEAGIGKKVTVRFLDDGSEDTYTIVTTMRENSLENLISVESPMGRALARRRAGDQAEVRTGSSSFMVEILSVETAGEDEQGSLRNY